MRRRNALVLVLAVLLPVAASATAAPLQPSSLTVVVIGVPDGYSLLGRWREKQLFAQDLRRPPHEQRLTFAVSAPAGKGRLQFWALRADRAGGNTYTVINATLQPGRHYTLTVVGDGVTQLRATLAETSSTEVALCHLTPACSGLAALAADARR